MRNKQSLLILAVLLAVCLAYGNSFQNGFHFDDFHTVTDNPAVRSLHNIPRFFTDATSFSVLPANQTYRPMVSTTLAVDYALGHGYLPFWFHIGTFLFFLGLIVLLYKLYFLLFEAIRPSPANTWLALFGAAWFGLHPAMAETVNYIIQRGDLYCTLGCVAALFVYARYPGLRRTGLYLLPLIFALLSKPPAAVFPLLLIGYVFFFEAKTRRMRTALLAAIPSIAATAVLMGLQAAMTPKSFAPSNLPPWDYRLTQPYVWLRYFAELFLPLHLNVDTDLGLFSTLNLQAILGLAFVVALCIAIWITARRRNLSPIAFGLLWFVVTQLPTSLYPLSEPENDHRMFFSFAGLILAVVWAGALLAERFITAERRAQWKPEFIAGAVLLLLAYGYGVHVRNIVWHDEESLWLDDVTKSPHNGRGLMIYGLTQMNKGAYPAALDYFERALVYTPNYPTLEINLGVVNGAMADLGDTSRTVEAEEHFQRAIRLAPGDDTAHAFYARWLVAHGKAPEAIPELQAAIALNPQRAMQRDLLIDAYNHTGDAAEAHEAAVSTLAVIPDDAAALQELAHPPAPQTGSTAGGESANDYVNESLALSQAGKFEESIAAARKALKINPKLATAWNNIAAGDESLHRWDDAIAAAQKAIALDPNFQLAKNNLAWSISQKKLGAH